jgi:hypothetical protein
VATLYFARKAQDRIRKISNRSCIKLDLTFIHHDLLREEYGMAVSRILEAPTILIT